jgi:23S rRNA (adenine2503-C2)-methyltransferase
MSEAIFGKTLSDLQALAREMDLPRYTARQLAGWLYGRQAASFEEMTDLSREARRRLAERYEIGVSAPRKESVSADGTKKYLFPAGPDRFVEAAYIPEEERNTLCLSVQVGCKMGCLFCMTGKQGFAGNLSPGAILNQYRSLPERDALSNVVYMGMGEPLDNLDSVLASLEVFTGSWGYGLSPRRLTVSTVGLLPALDTFLRKSRCHLAVSLHSPFEEERGRIMPVENVHPLDEVLQAVRRHSFDGRRRVSFEYILFRGFNDTPRHARELVRILSGIPCRVNLIPFHPIPGTPLEPSPPARMEEFQNALKSRGVLATIRRSRGLDIQAACGLLSTRELLARGGARP